MDAECADFLNNIACIPTKNTDRTVEALQTVEPVEVVAMWQVLEHLTKPLETISAALSALKSGGILVLSAPNPESFAFRVLGKYWPHLDAPRHTFLIPIRTIANHVRNLGAKIEFVTTNDPCAREWNRFGWEQWLRNCHPSFGKIRAISFIGRGLATLMKCIEQREGIGSTYTVVIRKQ